MKKNNTSGSHNQTAEAPTGLLFVYLRASTKYIDLLNAATKF